LDLTKLYKIDFGYESTSDYKHVFKHQIKDGTLNTRLRTNNKIRFSGEYKRCVTVNIKDV